MVFDFGKSHLPTSDTQRYHEESFLHESDDGKNGLYFIKWVIC